MAEQFQWVGLPRFLFFVCAELQRLLRQALSTPELQQPVMQEDGALAVFAVVVLNRLQLWAGLWRIAWDGGFPEVCQCR